MCIISGIHAASKRRHRRKFVIHLNHHDVNLPERWKLTARAPSIEPVCHSELWNGRARNKWLTRHWCRPLSAARVDIPLARKNNIPSESLTDISDGIFVRCILLLHTSPPLFLEFREWCGGMMRQTTFLRMPSSVGKVSFVFVLERRYRRNRKGLWCLFISLLLWQD